MDDILYLFNWNVRGLNDATKRAAVREVIDRMKPSIVCLQESKLASFSDALTREIAGPSFDSHISLDAAGTRDGVLLIWRSTDFAVDNISVRTFSITARLLPIGRAPPWFLTMSMARMMTRASLSSLMNSSLYTTPSRGPGLLSVIST